MFLRLTTHALFHVILGLALVNLGRLTWGQCALLGGVAVVTAASWTRRGAWLCRRGAGGLAPLHYAFMAALFLLTSFPIARGLPGAFTSPIAGGPSVWITGAIWLAAIVAAIERFASRKADAASGGTALIRWNAGLAVVISLLLAAAIAAATRALPIALHLQGGEPADSLLLVVFNGALLFFVMCRTFEAMPARQAPASPFRAAVSDYRPHFLALTLILSAAGAFDAARVALDVRRAHESLRRGDLPRAESFLREAADHNLTLGMNATGRRIHAALSDVYDRMLAAGPHDPALLVRAAAAQVAGDDESRADALLARAGLETAEPAVLDEATRLLAPYPRYAAGRISLAAGYAKNGGYERAGEILRGFLRLSPRHIAALDMLAAHAEKIGNVEEASRLRSQMVAGIEETAWRGEDGRILWTSKEAGAEVSLAPGEWEMSLAATATPAGDVWPIVQLNVDGSRVADLAIDSREERTYKAVFRTNKRGRVRVAFRMLNDQAAFKDGKMVGDTNAFLGGAIFKWTRP
ncbi:MAG: hypothetical protein HY897_12930 [Deltaproteobacteria bacterium]|nr:hypothetical protein [Deltaproteobacteria bacterium]